MLPLLSPNKVERILAEARAWIGTPWVHQGRKRGYACDCIGLVVETLRVVGSVQDFVYPAYSPLARPGQIASYLDTYLIEVPLDEMSFADVVLVRWKTIPTHLAFLGDRGGTERFSMIHSFRDANVVCEHAYMKEWRDRTSSAWRMREV